MRLNEIKTPALILDYNIMEKNIMRMQAKADQNNVKLRPHIKTHKCIEIAEIQEKSGAEGITVSTIQEAIYFSNFGFSDITWAFPLNKDYIDVALKLMKKINFAVLIDSFEAFELIKEKCILHRQKANVWLEIDTGQHRSGVNPNSEYAKRLFYNLIESKYLNFLGILTHAGHSYQAQSISEIKQISNEERNTMVEFKNSLKHAKDFLISIGSTPTISHSDKIDGVDEIRPGNYVFYDYTQVLLGCCKIEDCALSVLSTIVSINKNLNYIVIDAGALALSKDLGAHQINNYNGYGVVLYNNFSELYVSKVTQEHGIIFLKENQINKFKYGDKIRILMNHSCLTVPLFDYYNVVKDGELIDRWKIFRARDLFK